jgi:hypothetical protein
MLIVVDEPQPQGIGQSLSLRDGNHDDDEHHEVVVFGSQGRL